MSRDGPKPEITLRPAAPEDAPAIAGLITRLGYPTTAAQMAARMDRLAEQEAYATFVALGKGTLLGFIGVSHSLCYESDAPAGRILALSVDAQAQRRGVGAALVERAEAWLKARGATAVIVNSRHERQAAHRFYERQGYAATGLRFKKTL